MPHTSEDDIAARMRAAAVHFRQGRLAEAEAEFRALLDVRPYEMRCNLGLLYVNAGRLDEAERVYQEALDLRPDSPVAHHGLASLLLASGRYREGWAHYEHRDRFLGLADPKIDAPPWRGEDLSGKRLVVMGEQGLGDQIQFSRFLRTLPGDHVFVCATALYRLFDRNGFSVSPGAENVPVPEGDYWVRLLSLPHRLGISLDHVSGAAYLDAKASRPGGGIGLVPRGHPTHVNDRNRSLPDRVAAQVAALIEPFGAVDLRPEHTGARDMLETAQIIASLDLVITVDTSVAHLAGAMGKPVWILLPAIGTDWRWLRGRTDSPWYASARLYRQDQPGDWSDVLRRLEADLGSHRASGGG